MKHNIKSNGYSYRLRPVELEDAQFIIDTRLEDAEKSQFVHKISSDVNLQIDWLNNYFERENDYYFVIENLFTGESEGLISIYNVKDKKAEWGRWVLKSGSLASIEGVNLLYRVAFEKLNLEELYTMTITDNASVVDFHTGINAKLRKIHKDAVTLEGKVYDIAEQYIDKDYYYSTVKENLDNKCRKLFERNIKSNVGKFKFHHFGVATENIEKAFKDYPDYIRGDYFEDTNQEVKGLFINSESLPTLELLENLPNSHTLDNFIKNNVKIYHAGYLVEDIEKMYKFFIEKLNAKIVSDMKISTYFKKRICFLMLKNKEIIELVEV